MLSEALQRNAEHEAGLSNISGVLAVFFQAVAANNQRLKACPRPESVRGCVAASLRLE
jgi:hypothetical protein